MAVTCWRCGEGRTHIDRVNADNTVTASRAVHAGHRFHSNTTWPGVTLWHRRGEGRGRHSEGFCWLAKSRRAFLRTSTVGEGKVGILFTSRSTQSHVLHRAWRAPTPKTPTTDWKTQYVIFPTLNINVFSSHIRRNQQKAKNVHNTGEAVAGVWEKAMIQHFTRKSQPLTFQRILSLGLFMPKQISQKFNCIQIYPHPFPLDFLHFSDLFMHHL